MVGTELAHYRIDAQLGAGGMGVVYLAFDTRLRRQVAVKLLNESAVPGDSADRLLYEARAASALSHPNVCTVYEIGSASGGSYIAMEYVEGRTLAELVPIDGLPTETLVRYGSQIADALAHAHARGVIHRDLKSANVLVSVDGRVKVLDFGLAARVREDGIDVLTKSQGALSEFGALAGTLPYMAPEVLRGDRADERVDIWALGIILYEMACGALPFRGHTGFSLTGAILHETPALPAKMPPSLRAIIQRCLAKDPTQRYQKAMEVRVALDTLRSGILQVPSSAGVVVPTDRRSVLVLPFANLSSNPDTDYFSDGLTDEIIADLSNLQALRVISRTSSMRLKGETRDIVSVARDLNVQYVLEGTVRQIGPQLRVTAKLVDVQTDSPIWGHKYGGTTDDVFAIQETMSRSIVEALKVNLTADEERRLAERPIEDVRAYESYLKARQEMLRFTKDGLDRALAYLENSRRLVGDNILILSAIGHVHWQYVNAGVSADPANLAKARQYAEQILAAAPESGHGHRLLGLVQVHEGNMQGSIASLKRAVETDPNDPDALAWLSIFSAVAGKSAEARPWAERLVAIDPLTPLYQILPAMLSAMNGDFAGGADGFSRHYTSNLDNPGVRLAYGQVLAMNGQIDEACAIFDALLKDLPDTPFAQIGRAYAHALRGHADQARGALTPEVEAVCAGDAQYAWFVAECYSTIGDGDKAMEWLERATTLGFINYPLLAHHDPLLAAVRTDPRFPALMRDVEARWRAFTL